MINRHITQIAEWEMLIYKHEEELKRRFFPQRVLDRIFEVWFTSKRVRFEFVHCTEYSSEYPPPEIDYSFMLIQDLIDFCKEMKDKKYE